MAKATKKVDITLELSEAETLYLLDLTRNCLAEGAIESDENYAIREGIFKALFSPHTN